MEFQDFRVSVFGFWPSSTPRTATLRITTMATSGTQQQRHRQPSNCGRWLIDTLSTIM
jgi:hypothetical protein